MISLPDPEDVDAASLSNDRCELAIIGELLADSRLVDTAADRLEAKHFYRPLHARIFVAMVEAQGRREPMTSATVARHFADDSDFASGRYGDRLVDATRAAAEGHYLREHIAHLVDLSTRRSVAAALKALTNNVSKLAEPVADIVSAADTALTGLVPVTERVSKAPAHYFGARVVESLGKPIRGVRSGLLSSIDDLLGPLPPGSLTLGAGRPAMGKTASALSYSLGVAQNGHGVLYISLEMVGDELVERVLSDLTMQAGNGVRVERIRDPEVISKGEIQRVREANDRLRQLPFEIIDRSGTLDDVRRDIRRHKRLLGTQGIGLGLVVIDYLTLLKKSHQRTSLYEHATEVSRGLKVLAKEEEVAVFAMAQLNREVEKREDKRPEVHDLRDSGQLEQDADSIVLFYREEEYLAKTEPQNRQSADYLKWQDEMDAVRGRIEFICGKRRHGKKGKRTGYFYGDFQAVRGHDFQRYEGMSR